MISILDKFKFAYDIISKNKSSSSLQIDLERSSIKSKKKRKPEWDFELFQYTFSKSLFKVKQSASVCITDTGRIEYIYLTTIDYNQIAEVIRYIESDYRFTLFKQNEKHTLYFTPVEDLYVSIMQNPFSNTEHAVRISYGELK